VAPDGGRHARASSGAFRPDPLAPTRPRSSLDEGTGALLVASTRHAAGSEEEVPPESPPVLFPVSRILPFVVVGLGALYGIVVRGWLIRRSSLFADEAVVGLMARQIDHGHPNAFYWGQRYGGVEPYMAAAMLRASDTATALNATPALLAAVAAVLLGWVVWLLAQRVAWAALAGVATWVWSYAYVWNSTRELGFRFATLCCGVALIGAAVWIWRSGNTVVRAALLGVAAGLGWWASPEILYFAVPSAVLLVACSRRFGGRGDLFATWPLVAALAAFALGAAPWLYANVTSRLGSLRHGAYPSSGSGYLSRLGSFFRDVLPAQLGARTVPSGAWVGGALVGKTVFFLEIAGLLAAIVVAVVRVPIGRAAVPGLAAASALVAFPFLYAAVPSSGYTVDSRYGIYFGVLAVLLVAVVSITGTTSAPVARDATRTERHAGQPAHARRDTPAPELGADEGPSVGPGRLVLGSLLVVCAALLTMAGAYAGAGVPRDPLAALRQWRAPAQPALGIARSLEAQGITASYGSYWSAYPLEFFGAPSIAVSPSPLDVNRSSGLYDQVFSAPSPAWLFAAPGQEAASAAIFSNPQPGPGPYDEQSFLAYLQALGLTWRVVHVGPLDAVVPQRPVIPPG
jgi:hypothetical protein